MVSFQSLSGWDPPASPSPELEYISVLRPFQCEVCKCMHMKHSKWKALLGRGQSVGIVGGSEELPAWSLGPGTWRGETPFDKIYLSGSQTSTILSWRRGCEASQDLTPSSLISLTATSLIIFGAMCTTMIYQLIIAICSPPIPMGQLRIMLALLQRHACCQGSCQACTCSGSSQVWEIRCKYTEAVRF